MSPAKSSFAQMTIVCIFLTIICIAHVAKSQNTDVPREPPRRVATDAPNSDSDANTIGPYGEDHHGHSHGGHDHSPARTRPKSDSAGAPMTAPDELGPYNCYNCSSHPSHEGSQCLTNMEQFLVECPPNANGCYKIEQWVDFDFNSSDPRTSRHHYVIRQCSRLGNPKKPCYYKAGFGGRQNVCFCQGDGCNSGHSLTSSVLAAVVSAALGLFVSGKLGLFL